MAYWGFLIGYFKTNDLNAHLWYHN